MSVRRRQKLLRLVPEGLPVTRQWLIKQDKDLDRHAVDNLVKSGQLVSLAHGVYMRPYTTLTWEGVVCCLQNVLKTDLTVGGMTALELKSLSHYVALSGKMTIHLYGSTSLPKWVNSVLPDVEFIRRNLRAQFDTPDDLIAAPFGTSAQRNQECKSPPTILLVCRTASVRMV